MIQATRTARVLHVVESFGGGVVSALMQYVVATPEFEHHLLRTIGPDFADDGELARFASVRELSGHPLRAARQVRGAMREISPDVIHAHSSLGGALVRTSVRNRKPARIVYTPHGFASERRDIMYSTRLAFAAAERALSWNTEVLAACSVREELIARRGRSPHVVFVPNVAEPDLATLRSAPREGRVVGLGRLAVQKDPAFFLATVEALRNEGVVLDPVWIGGGSSRMAATLADCGIRVTGWLPRRAALHQLAAAEVYLHTSAWDAGPMALLEATAIGVPSVARRVESLPGLPSSASASSPAAVASVARQLLKDASRRGPNLAAWRETFSVHTPEEQRRRLLDIYVPAGKGVS